MRSSGYRHVRTLSIAIIGIAMVTVTGCVGRAESANGNIRSCTPSMTDVRGGGMLTVESPLYHWADMQ
ncbi:MAG: hypothetical protein H0V44_14710 [Planctomycetes bacterium]|nr:hypothetical protein [Planctomycetota bacterium]